jgi:hypothetical protein
MAEFSSNISSSGKTGGTCQRSGPYRSSRTGVVVYFKQGAKFTADADGKSTSWSYLSSTSQSSSTSVSLQ